MRISHLFFFLLLLRVSGIEAQTKRGMTPIDVASLKMTGSAVLSPDGRLVAYTLRVQPDPKVENKPARLELHVYNTETDQSSPFVTRGSVRNPSFRPAHDVVTFLNRLGDDKLTGLYQIGLHGGEASMLFQHETSITQYQWSPDGKTLAFIATKPAVKVKSDLPYTPELYEQQTSPQRAFVVQPGTGQPVELKEEGHFTSIEWSPDGTKVLCAVSPTPLVDDVLMAQKLKIFETSSGKLINTIAHAGKLGDAKWSPDSRQVAFIGGADLHDPIAGRLFVAGTVSGKPLQLHAGWEGMFEQIQWKNSNQIHFMGSESVESVFGTITPEAKAKPSFTPVEKGWSINQFDLHPDGTVVFIADSYNHPPELFIDIKGQGSRRRVTHSNPWLADIEFGRQEVVRYKAQDGLEIDGLLIRPVGEESGKKYPLITIVHGGPEAHFNNGWLTGYSNAGQVGSAEGYAVFYPNYRGSTGRGLAFILTSQGDAAGKEFDDVVDGVDYLISTGLVDKDKVGVTGGSYGGYATGWFATRYSERFAAGVMFVGISNKVSKWGTTDIPNEEYLVHARKWVYEDYDFFLKRSPVYYADQCKTPLLIMHGKEDTRVHPSQSMELYRHIKSRTETPVELVFYPGEGHGNANATARYDYNLRMMAWFDKYLKGIDCSRS